MNSPPLTMPAPLALPCSPCIVDDAPAAPHRHRPLECVVCGRFTRTRCVACSVVFYCSKSCQSSDWSVHRCECSALGSAKRRRVEGISLLASTRRVWAMGPSMLDSA
eukprot:4770038-Prymnesium_polylepis.1